MVANVKSSPVESGDYAETSVTIEHFSATELGVLLDGFRQNGFFVTFHDGEVEFIKQDLRRGSEEDHILEVVYNTAQSGVGGGRKSLVPAYCAIRGIRICNSDAYVASLTRQKFHVHCILKRVGLPTAATWCYQPPTGWIGGAPAPKQRVIAKAAYESASIGLTANCVGDVNHEFEQMLKEKCAIYRQPFIVQEFVEGYEVEVPLLDIDRMRAIEVVSVQLDGNVYLGDRVLYYDVIDAETYQYAPSTHLTQELKTQLATIAEAAAEALGIRGIGRIDFRLNKAGCPYITDVATSPHLVPHGSFSRSFAWNGYTHADMLAAMIGANQRHWKRF
jgi:D-alanine-D-alanine ligase